MAEPVNLSKLVMVVISDLPNRSAYTKDGKEGIKNNNEEKTISNVLRHTFLTSNRNLAERHRTGISLDQSIQKSIMVNNHSSHKPSLISW